MEGSKLKTFLHHIKYRLVLKFKPRKNRVYAQFYRFSNQYKALVERILPPYRSVPSGDSEPLDVIVFACCNGTEAFLFPGRRDDAAWPRGTVAGEATPREQIRVVRHPDMLKMTNH